MKIQILEQREIAIARVFADNHRLRADERRDKVVSFGFQVSRLAKKETILGPAKDGNRTGEI